MRTLLALLFLSLAPGAISAAQAQSLGGLSWMNGCWRVQNAHRSITEIWVSPPANAMMGYAFTLVEGEPAGWEQTRIQMIEGVPHFVAMPGGAPPVAFAMVESGENSVAFENPAHDFPTRLTYRRDGDLLIARASAGEDGVDFRYQRIDCAAAYEP
jgi:hypothetical protein